MKHTECIITGCDFVDPNERRWVHGDLFACGDTYIFNACMKSEKLGLNPAWQYDSPHSAAANAISCRDGNYFEKRGVIVFPRESAEMNDAASLYVAPKYRTK